MTRLVEIETTPTLESSQLIGALTRQGVKCSLPSHHDATHDNRGASLTIRVEGEVGDLVSKVMRALDHAIAARGLPLMAQRIGESAFVVRPPAG